jgi:hypothetical protein
MTYRHHIALALVGIGLTMPCAIYGGQAASATAPAKIDHVATDALNAMGAYMRTLTTFQVQSTTSRDEVLDDGQKITVDGTVDLLVKRPNGMRADIVTDAHHRTFFFDGRNFTIWARLLNYYATVPAPSTLAEFGDVLSDKYGIELPLADLFYWGTEKSKVGAITAASDLGPSQIGGVTCEHYAFRQEGIDWQVWIQSGDYPLPRKLVLTTTDDEARPQYSSVMTWNLAPSFNDFAFTFSPPADALKIVLTDLKAGGGLERR